MTNPTGLLTCLAILSFSVVNAAPPPGLEGAEVRLPYEELRRLIEAGRQKKEECALIPPALVLSRLKLSMDGDTPVIDGEFRTVRFSEGFSRVALIGGELSIESQETEGDALVMHDSMLCRVDEGAGSSDTRLRFRTTGDRRGFELVFPACPGTMVDTSGLPEQALLAVTLGKTERIIPRGGRYAVPAEQTTLRFRILDEEESLEAQRPPEPSSWSWQHQALVIPEATWLLSMEQDGSMLAEGVIEVEHGMAQGVVLDTPDGMVLLSCQVEGRAVEPVNLGEGRIEITVPARGERGAKPTRIALSFTSKGKAFDPLEGTLALALPQTPLFIRSLTWRVDLPSGLYGGDKRQSNAGGGGS